MKKLVLATIVGIVLVLSGCAGYGGATTNNSLHSGTQPAQGPFPSQVVGP